MKASSGGEGPQTSLSAGVKGAAPLQIGVVGLWHLGSVTIAGLLRMGHSVVAYDFDSKAVDSIRSGAEPVSEPGVGEVLREAISEGTLTIERDARSLSAVSVICFTYDTPVSSDDEPDADWLESRFLDIVPFVRSDATVIVSSQTIIGTCGRWRCLLRSASSSADIVYMPENLRLGSALTGMMSPRDLIIGAESQSAIDVVVKVFEPIVSSVITMNLASAELSKHAINSYLAMSVVFANSLAGIAENHGASMKDVLLGLRSDDRVSPRAPMRPGLPFSGGTLGRDLRSLEQRGAKSSGSFFSRILEINNAGVEDVVERIQQLSAGHRQDQVKIAVWGVTYKPGTSTLRRSIPMQIMNSLSDKKLAVSVFDPGADYSEVEGEVKFEIGNDPIEICCDADVLVLLTGWDQFRSPAWGEVAQAMRGNIIFDAIGLWAESGLPDEFDYHTIGEG